MLANEIDRAPAKAQSALLEAVQETQVTIGDERFPLPRPFLVNPLEQEGAYPLPEAQTDRFMLELRIGYPERGEELEILERMTATAEEEPVPAVAVPIADPAASGGSSAQAISPRTSRTRSVARRTCVDLACRR